MKRFSIVFVAVAVVLCMAACGGGDSNGGGDEGVKTYTQEVKMSWQQENKNVTMTTGWKTSDISEMTGAASWLSVSIYDPLQLTLKTTDDNEEKNDRSCTVTIIHRNGDKLLLHVVQEGKPDSQNDPSNEQDEPKTGIDDIHDTPSDQPAYSPRR